MANRPRTPAAARREYPARPLVGVGIALLRPDAVLLVRRAKPPAQDAWSLPGGAQRLGETAEDAARRELAEETGLVAGALHLAGHVDSIHRDPDGRVRFHYTILDFCARYVAGQARASGDAADLAWVGLDQLGEYGVWEEARHIIRRSRVLLVNDGDLHKD